MRNMKWSAVVWVLEDTNTPGAFFTTDGPNLWGNKDNAKLFTDPLRARRFVDILSGLGHKVTTRELDNPSRDPLADLTTALDMLTRVAPKEDRKIGWVN